MVPQKKTENYVVDAKEIRTTSRGRVYNRESSFTQEEAFFEGLESVADSTTPQPPKAPKANPYHYFSDKIRPRLVELDTPNDQIFAKIAEIWNSNDPTKKRYERQFYNAWIDYYMETAKWIEEHPHDADRIIEEERKSNMDYPERKKRARKQYNRKMDDDTDVGQNHPHHTQLLGAPLSQLHHHQQHPSLGSINSPMIMQDHTNVNSQR
ncbi:hypothetical protein PROFUN_03195 [Planoprotostelium fungivorum]|uniref:Uncharacterized protein n=1 Tax=Planoprotostelium fungivorum TaxID=1890364 RepID=A0A2P6NX53_9EUKA|nr:hypothetical protein PROFUN_03195 [Planoprotostelium fungivorum]